MTAGEPPASRFPQERSSVGAAVQHQGFAGAERPFQVGAVRVDAEDVQGGAVIRDRIGVERRACQNFMATGRQAERCALPVGSGHYCAHLDDDIEGSDALRQRHIPDAEQFREVVPECSSNRLFPRRRLNPGGRVSRKLHTLRAAPIVVDDVSGSDFLAGEGFGRQDFMPHLNGKRAGSGGYFVGDGKVLAATESLKV